MDNKPPSMPSYFELIASLQADQKRVALERRRGPAYHRKWRDTNGVRAGVEQGLDEHRIAIGSAGPSLAEESNTSW